jgi:hypothetical protein
MNNPTDIIERYKLIRSRWDAEDSLLVSRTGVFLTANSIFFAASQLQHDPDPTFKIGVMVFSVVISLLWLTTSWHSFNVIARLYREARDYSPEEIACIYRIQPVFVRPNTVFGKLLPIVVIVSWIVYLAWCTRNMGAWAVSICFALLIAFASGIVYAEMHTRKLRAAVQREKWS